MSLNFMIILEIKWKQISMVLDIENKLDKQDFLKIKQTTGTKLWVKAW